MDFREESNEQRTSDRDLLQSIRYRVGDIEREIQRNHEWHEKRAEKEDERRDSDNKSYARLERRVGKIERSLYLVLGGILTISALLKIAPILLQWLTKP
jgi:hypothetical protein